VTVRKSTITFASAAALACALPITKACEGYWPTAKVDTIGTGRPCTGGYGETEHVKCGESHPEKYWADLLVVKLKRYDAEIGHCIHVELPDQTRAAVVIFAYNVGSAGACRSTTIRKMNDGDIRGGCDALMQWTRAQGHVVPGLVNRRAKERKLCLAGLDAPKVVPIPAPAPGYPCGKFHCEPPVVPSFWQHWFGWMFK
jgi:lysozyme